MAIRIKCGNGQMGPLIINGRGQRQKLIQYLYPHIFYKWGEQLGSSADWLPHSENRSTSIIVTQLAPQTAAVIAAAIVCYKYTVLYKHSLAKNVQIA